MDPNPAELAPSSSGMPPKRRVREVDSASGWLYSDDEKSSLHASTSALLPALQTELALPRMLADRRPLPCDEEAEDVGRWEEVDARALRIYVSESGLVPALVLVDVEFPLAWSRAVMCSGPMSTTVGPEACLRLVETADGAANVCESFRECI